jgi:PAS domain S-box-containing protein
MTPLPFTTDAILESLSDGFQAFDRQWRYAYLNRRAEQILGRKREELLGKVCWEEYPQAVGTEFHQKYLEAMQTGKLVTFEYFCPHEKRWAEFSLQPYPGGLGAFTRDITERKQAEQALRASMEALRQSQAELEDFFENSTVGLHWVDANGIVVRANRAELEMLGYSAEEYIGHSIAEFHADPDVIADILHRLMSGQVLEDYQARLRCKDGSLRQVLISSSVLFKGGEFVHTRCFTRDITDKFIAEAERRRAAEEAQMAAELRSALEALKESEERFRLLVEQVQDYAIFLLDPEGNITTWNAGAQRFKGYTAAEIIGQHFSRFYSQDDIARRHPWNELEIARREGRYEEEGWRVRKDGSRFWASVVITALRDEEGKLRGFAKVTRDITEHRQREQEKAAASLAEQQRRVLRDVLASVTEGRLILCQSAFDLPQRLPALHDSSSSSSSGDSNEPRLAPPHQLPLSPQTLRQVRKRTAQAAQSVGFDKDRGNALLTAVGEATMNAVTHGRDGLASVGVDPEMGRVQVWVEDKGSGIDMGSLPRAALEHGYSTAGTLGHGFKMMLQCVDRLWLLTGPSGTTVVLEQGREASLPNWLLEK